MSSSANSVCDNDRSATASFAVNKLHGLCVQERRVEVYISDRKLQCRRSGNRSVVEQSRVGGDISDCFS